VQTASRASAFCTIRSCGAGLSAAATDVARKQPTQAPQAMIVRAFIDRLSLSSQIAAPRHSSPSIFCATIMEAGLMQIKVL
jgi:hypothetical protein